ncbi:MAG: hypothetical protein SPLM_09730 [Spiroplasma phoeniceum]
MNKYILCYKTDKGNIPCKIPFGDYITRTDLKYTEINLLWDWEYLLTVLMKKIIILKRK